jgi:hypothetical protein
MTRVVRFDSDFSPEASRGARFALAEQGVRVDSLDSSILVAGQTREDSLSTDDFRAGMVDRNRSAWQTPAADNASDALELETPRQREDADIAFTLDDIRAASQAAARDAWKGGTSAAAAPAIAWKRAPDGTFMARV